jgi:hypothetical protein
MCTIVTDKFPNNGWPIFLVVRGNMDESSVVPAKLVLCHKRGPKLLNHSYGHSNIDL